MMIGENTKQIAILYIVYNVFILLLFICIAICLSIILSIVGRTGSVSKSWNVQEKQCCGNKDFGYFEIENVKIMDANEVRRVAR